MFDRAENQKKKMQYVDAIVSKISPILMGLNHYQVSVLLDEVKELILDTTIFAASTGMHNPPLSVENSDREGCETTQ